MRGWNEEEEEEEMKQKKGWVKTWLRGCCAETGGWLELASY